jgi:hypothetical protein
MTRLWALAENARRGAKKHLGCPEPQARASVMVGSQRHLRLPLSDVPAEADLIHPPLKTTQKKSAGKIQCERQAMRAL